jgi:ribosomal protein S21
MWENMLRGMRKRKYVEKITEERVRENGSEH